ncbi:hypothetical protein KC345_g2679 [Hortaea werneckii]|nr:hypothetical protein KC345_g2679 [Hortaea werneckii]
MGKKEKSKKHKTHKAEDLHQSNLTLQSGAYQPSGNASGSSYDQQYGYLPPLQSQAQSQNQWPAVQNPVPQPQGWHGGQQYGESSSNMQQQTTTTTHVTRHVQHLTSRRQARGHQEQQQQQPFQPAPPPLLQQPHQPPPPAQQQNTIDYESLRVALPTPQTPTPAPARRDRYPLQQPQPQPSPASRRDIPDPDSLRVDAPPSRPSRLARTNRQQTTRTTTTTTESYEGQHDGGETRRQAEAEGPAAVERYERMVADVLVSSGSCPMGVHWMNMRGGYICAAGTHWISHQAIDDYLGGRDVVPRVESVNEPPQIAGLTHPYASVHPPRAFGLAGMGPYMAHFSYMQLLAAHGAHARIVRASSRRRGREAEGLGEKPCECVRILRMRVVESSEDNPRDVSRVRNPTYASSGHFQVGLPQ